MGYMGFGMRKEVYTKKAKRPSKKLIKLHQSELKKLDDYTSTSKFSDEEINIAKNKIQKKVKKQTRNKYLTLILIILSAIILAILLTKI